MEIPVISVIMPIYNVEKYLTDSIVSVLNQTYHNLEIILVDDGATDLSGSICDQFKEKDTRIIVVHKSNGGLSSARNAGLDIATGEYIFFLDSDDVLESNAIETLYNNMMMTGADLSALSISIIDEHGIAYDEECFDLTNEVEVISEREYWNHIKSTNIVAIVAWSKLYKAEYFKTLRFEYGKLHEDEGIISEVMAQCNTIACTRNKLLRYRQRKDSIMGQGFKLKSLDKSEFLAKQTTYFLSRKYYENVNEWFEKGSGMLIYAKDTLDYKGDSAVRNRVDEIYGVYLKLIKSIYKEIHSSKWLVKKVLFSFGLSTYQKTIKRIQK